MIIYSCITNGYDEISDDHYYDPNVKYVMFHDGTIEKKGPWEFIELNVDETCPVRKSYHPKHLPHHYFDNGEYVVWIDGCYTITKNFVEFTKNNLLNEELVVQHHPSKRTLIEEFAKLYYNGFSTREECLDFAEKIRSSGYNIQKYNQTVNCVLWRKICTNTNNWNETWRYWYDIGVNRDQISSEIADFFVPGLEKINLLLNLDNKLHRKIPYKVSYLNKEKPGIRDIMNFIDDLSKIFKLNAKTNFRIEKVLNEEDKKLLDMPIFDVDSIDNDSLVVYTCITNGYDEFPDENYYDPEVKYVCFHDGTVTKKGPWEFIDIRDYSDIKCPRILSSYPKINPHLFFQEGTNTVWIDACYVLTKKFIEISKKCFPFTILRHPFKFSYYEEMVEGFLCAFFTYEDAIIITKILKEDGYNFKKYRSPLGTSVWRTITDETILFDEYWWKYAQIGPNRDQISFDAALQFSKADPEIIEQRNDIGINFGMHNKIGRRGKHPQRGDVNQWKNKDALIKDIEVITKLSSKMHLRYKNHAHTMNAHGIDFGDMEL